MLTTARIPLRKPERLSGRRLLRIFIMESVLHSRNVPRTATLIACSPDLLIGIKIISGALLEVAEACNLEVAKVEAGEIRLAPLPDGSRRERWCSF